MPDIDTSLGDLWWLKGQTNTEPAPNYVLQGMQLATQQNQQKRDNMMKMLEFNLREKEANVKMQGELMNQKMTHDFMEDVPKINLWTMQLAQDANAPPPTNLTSPKSLELVDQIRLRQSQSIVIKDSSKAFADRVKNLNLISPELAGSFAPYIGRVPTPDLLDKLSTAEITARNQQQSDLAIPLQPGEKRTTKIGGILYTATGPKATTPEEDELRKRSLDVQWLRATNTAAQIAARDKSIGVQEQAQINRFLKTNPDLQARVNEAQSTLISAQTRIDELTKEKAAGKTTDKSFFHPFRTLDESLASATAERDAAKEKHDELLDSIRKLYSFPATTPSAPVTAPVKQFNYVPGQGLQPVE